MPLIFGFVGLVATYFLTTKSNGDSILTPTTTTNDPVGLPSWIIPTVLLGVGAVLLYKEGAKLLKV